MKKLFLLLAACGIVGVSYANEPANPVNVYNYTNCSCNIVDIIINKDGTKKTVQTINCNNQGVPEDVYGYYQVSESHPDTSKQPVTVTPVVSRAAGSELFTAVPMYENALNEYYYLISSSYPPTRSDSGISPSDEDSVHPGDSLVVVQLHYDKMPSAKLMPFPQKNFNVKTCQYIPSNLNLGVQKVMR